MIRNAGPTRLMLCVAGLLAPILCGCRGPGVIFPPPRVPIVWPAAPETPRIAWVGQLQTEADLKPGTTALEGLGQVLFGKKSIRSMLTPFGVCTDGKNRVFVADSNAQVVHVFDLETRKYAMWQPSEKEKFSQPVSAAWDPRGRLFVSDPPAGSIFVFDASGTKIAEWGRGQLKRPCGIGIDSAGGRILVADAGAHQVVVFTMEGAISHRIGQRGADLGNFNYPTYVTVDHKGRIYVSDTLNFRIQQFSPDLKTVRQIGSHGDSPGYLAQPKGIAVDSEDHLYIVDSKFEAVQIFNENGRLLMDFGEEGPGPGEFWLPSTIFIDANDRIWIADCYNRRVQVFDYRRNAAPTTRPEPQP